MAGQDSSRYQPVRGLPSYLLSCNDADLSTDSDGASRIFAASTCSGRLAKTASLHSYHTCHVLFLT